MVRARRRARRLRGDDARRVARRRPRHQASRASEQNLDFSPSLEIARAVREQLDWDEIRRRCAGHPYAEAFLFLVEALDVAPAPLRQPARSP
jgi:hypothetical protein